MLVFARFRNVSVKLGNISISGGPAMGRPTPVNDLITFANMFINKWHERRKHLHSAYHSGCLKCLKSPGLAC